MLYAPASEETDQTMLITIDTTTYFTGATVAALASCWPNPGARLESDHVPSLAGRRAS
jgi:hypothetical protein